jgi:hypothetical protein
VLQVLERALTVSARAVSVLWTQFVFHLASSWDCHRYPLTSWVIIRDSQVHGPEEHL